MNLFNGVLAREQDGDSDETNDPDGAIYTDNPRGILEFGSFRGHDRVFNWQEIYNSPSQ